MKNNVANDQATVLTREMAKDILAKRRDRILAVPEGIQVLDFDFANQFDERNSLYYFYQINIPASVTKIEGVTLTYGPIWASEDRLECFDEINVASDNPAYCSIDGVLFTKDMKSLIRYPCGKPEKNYAIPDGVQVIEPNAFQDNHFLEKISFPTSVVKIDSYAFESCEKLRRVDLSEGLRVIEDCAFLFCNIARIALPSSLTKIHWTNLMDTSAGIEILEIPDSEIEVDMSEYNGDDWYAPPLLLIQKNKAFERFARRNKRNYFVGYETDEDGIIWSKDGSTLINFPAEWPEEEYTAPKKMTAIFKHAFDDSNVKRVLVSQEPQLTGKVSVNFFCRLDPKLKETQDPRYLEIIVSE